MMIFVIAYSVNNVQMRMAKYNVSMLRILDLIKKTLKTIKT